MCNSPPSLFHPIHTQSLPLPQNGQNIIPLSLRSIILTLDTKYALLDALPAAVFNDQSGQPATFDAARVEAAGVGVKGKAAVGVVAIEDGGALGAGKETLVFVPELWGFSLAVGEGLGGGG